MTKKLALFLALACLYIAKAASSQDSDLAQKTIPWGMMEDYYINANEFNSAQTSGKAHTFDAKKSVNINNSEFTKTVKFIDKKGLSQITYMTKPSDNDFENTCSMTQSYINNIYGQRTNEVHILNQGANNYTEVIWTSKLDRIVRLICFSPNKSNVVSVSFYPRWMVLDCTMRAQDPENKKTNDRRAFFYFDQSNEEVRFFNNMEVSLPFTSTFKDGRIAFSHNNEGDRTTIDLNTGVIMSKFIDDKGHDQLLIGKCKKQ